MSKTCRHAKKSELFAKRGTCHDCGVKEGEFHEYGCDMERCPFCGGQLVTCGCCNKALYYKTFNYDHPTLGLPKAVYRHGLSKRMERRWLQMLEAKGRVPYIRWPNHCAKCGVLWPEMFVVPNEEWERYVQISKRDSMVCRPCYDRIKRWIDACRKGRPK